MSELHFLLDLPNEQQLIDFATLVQSLPSEESHENSPAESTSKWDKMAHLALSEAEDEFLGECDEETRNALMQHDQRERDLSKLPYEELLASVFTKETLIYLNENWPISEFTSKTFFEMLELSPCISGSYIVTTDLDYYDLEMNEDQSGVGEGKRKKLLKKEIGRCLKGIAKTMGGSTKVIKRHQLFDLMYSDGSGSQVDLLKGLNGFLSESNGVDGAIKALYKTITNNCRPSVQELLAEHITEKGIEAAKIILRNGSTIEPMDSIIKSKKKIIDKDGADPTKYADLFVSLVSCLYEIDQEMGCSDSMDMSNTEPFEDFAQQYRTVFTSNKLDLYFCNYFEQQFVKITTEEYFLTAVQHFDQTLYFIDFLLGFVSDEGARELFYEGIENYDDILSWQEYLLLAALSQVEDDSLAA